MDPTFYPPAPGNGPQCGGQPAGNDASAQPYSDPGAPGYCPPPYGGPAPNYPYPEYGYPQAANPYVVPEGGYPQPPVYPQYQGYPSVMQPPYAVGTGVFRRTDPRMKAASRTFNCMCFLTIAQTVLGVLAGTIFGMIEVYSGQTFLSESYGMMWFSAAMVPLSTLLPFFLYFLISRQDPADCLRFEKVGFFGGLLCVLGGLGICLAANLPAIAVQNMLDFLFGYEPSSSYMPEQESWGMFILEFSVTAILVPVMEEFAFRGILLSALRKHGLGFSIVGSALIFGLAHMDLSTVIFAVVAGFVFGFLYAYTNNLWITVTIHALNNGLSVISSYSGFLFGENMADLVSALLLYGPMALGGIALLLLLIFKRNMFAAISRNRKRSYSRNSNPLFQGIVRAPGFWVLAGMMALYTIFLCTLNGVNYG